MVNKGPHRGYTNLGQFYITEEDLVVSAPSPHTPHPPPLQTLTCYEVITRVRKSCDLP